MNGLAFSPSSNVLGFVTHDCEVNFLTDLTKAVTAEKKDKPESSKMLHVGNPHLSCMFVDESTMLAAGYDKVPFVYKSSGKDWSMTSALDAGMSKQRENKITGNTFKDKRVYFNPDIKLSSAAELKDTNTKHQNFINCFRVFAQQGGKPVALCSSDANGYLNYW